MVTNFRANAAYRKKTLAYVVTVLGIIVSVGVLHGAALQYVSAALAVLGGLGVHGLTNGPAPTTASPGSSEQGAVDAVTLLVVFVIIVILLKVLHLI